MTDSAEPIYPDIRLLYYLFDPETKEYLCLYSPIPNPYYSPKKNPESKPYMPLPSNVTDKEPLETAENQVTVFDKKTQNGVLRLILGIRNIGISKLKSLISLPKSVKIQPKPGRILNLMMIEKFGMKNLILGFFRLKFFMS